MNLDDNILIKRLIKKEDPLVKLVLFIKMQLPKSIIFYIVLVLIQFIGLITVSTNYGYRLDLNKNPNNFMTSLTSVVYMGNMSFYIYEIIG